MTWQRWMKCLVCRENDSRSTDAEDYFCQDCGERYSDYQRTGSCRAPFVWSLERDIAALVSVNHYRVDPPERVEGMPYPITLRFEAAHSGRIIYDPMDGDDEEFVARLEDLPPVAPVPSVDPNNENPRQWISELVAEQRQFLDLRANFTLDQTFILDAVSRGVRETAGLRSVESRGFKRLDTTQTEAKPQEAAQVPTRFARLCQDSD